MARGQLSAAAAAVAAHLALLAAFTVLASAQIPEPNCNSNLNEGNEVWSSVPNFIGAGAGTFWWGVKAPSTHTPVSWIDMCAKRLEVCQSDIKVAGSLSGFKPTCVCDMWSCLHRQPAAEADSRPACHHLMPQLLSFYCDAARFVNATCAEPAYVPLPANGACPKLPAEGFTFDDMPGDGIRIPNGYQGLLWENWYMLNGDTYQIKNGYYAGVISSPNVAFNGFGYPAYITAPAGGLLTLRNLWLTSAWDEENEVTISAGDERGQTVGEYVTTLTTDNPREIDFTKLPKGSYKGTFEGVKHIGIDTWATQIALDNLVVELHPEPGQEIMRLPVPQRPLEFMPAPPGASAPIRKGVDVSPERKPGNTSITGRFKTLSFPGAQQLKLNTNSTLKP